jgi:hypothetical protein
MYGNLPSGLETSASSPLPTPVSFNEEMQVNLKAPPGHLSLTLSEEEFQELMGSFNKFVGKDHDCLQDKTVMGHLFDVTAGQVRRNVNGGFASVCSAMCYCLAQLPCVIAVLQPVTRLQNGVMHMPTWLSCMHRWA